MSLQANESLQGMTGTRRAFALWMLSFIALTLCLAGCSKDSKENEPVVSVQVVPVQKQALEQTVNSEAVLFPLQQAALTPKISAPVKTFYVKRGSKVRKAPDHCAERLACGLHRSPQRASSVQHSEQIGPW